MLQVFGGRDYLAGKMKFEDIEAIAKGSYGFFTIESRGLYEPQGIASITRFSMAF